MNTHTLKCAHVRELLEAYFEKALAPRESAAVAFHLEQCPSCARELAQIERIVSALEAAPHTEPQADLTRQISARVASLPTPVTGRLGVGWHRLAAWAAGLIVTLSLWRWLLPVVVSGGAARLPLAGWEHQLTTATRTRMEALFHGLHSLWVLLKEAPEAFGLAAIKIAPVVGLYMTLEVVVIAVIIVFAHRTRRPRSLPVNVLF